MNPFIPVTATDPSGAIVKTFAITVVPETGEYILKAATTEAGEYRGSENLARGTDLDVLGEYMGDALDALEDAGWSVS